MAKIQLTRGGFALVDRKDYELLAQWKWALGNDGYATRIIKVNGGVKRIFMHRVVNNTPIGLLTDHINGNRTDNRSKNLRTCSRAENVVNSQVRVDNKSGYKGVSRNGKRWAARITIGQKTIYIGTFDDPISAALAYNGAATFYYKDFAVLNKTD